MLLACKPYLAAHITSATWSTMALNFLRIPNHIPVLLITSNLLVVFHGCFPLCSLLLLSVVFTLVTVLIHLSQLQSQTDNRHELAHAWGCHRHAARHFTGTYVIPSHDRNLVTVM